MPVRWKQLAPHRGEPVGNGTGAASPSAPKQVLRSLFRSSLSLSASQSTHARRGVCDKSKRGQLLDNSETPPRLFREAKIATGALPLLTLVWL